MKTRIIGLFILLFCVQLSFSQDSVVEQEIIQLSKEKWVWMAEKDVGKLSELFHEKAVFVHMGGSWGTEQELNIIKGEVIWYKNAEVYNASVNFIDKTAILLTRIDLLAVVRGNEVTNPFIVTEVYINENGVWKLGSMSFTKVMNDVSK